MSTHRPAVDLKFWQAVIAWQSGDFEPLERAMLHGHHPKTHDETKLLVAVMRQAKVKKRRGRKLDTGVWIAASNLSNRQEGRDWTRRGNRRRSLAVD